MYIGDDRHKVTTKDHTEDYKNIQCKLLLGRLIIDTNSYSDTIFSIRFNST